MSPLAKNFSAMRLLDVDHVGLAFPCRWFRTDLVVAGQVVEEGSMPMSTSDWNPEAYAPGFSASVDVNGIEWELFSPEAQMAEILPLFSPLD
jgi:hypothetical protein